MKRLQLPILLGSILLAFTACDDNLEIEPAQSLDTETVFTNERNVGSVLLGTYAEAGEDESYGGQLQIMADLLGSNDFVSWFGTFFQPEEVINKQILVDNTWVSGYWDNAYATVNQANLVLDNIGIVTSSDAERDRIEGEARFLRALTYFDLVRHFGSSDMGVPLRTTGVTQFETGLEIERSSTSEVYDLVISDLERAAEALPETNSFFADRFSAIGLLARVHLQLGNYEEALEAANTVITESDHTLTATFADAFNNDANSTEDLFAFQVTSQGGDNDLIVHYASEGNGGRGGDIAIRDTYLELFGEGDERGEFFYIGDFGDMLTSKYTNQFGNIPVIRLAEMYLIRAEANLELDSEEGATVVEDLNTIRGRSGAELLGDNADIDVNFILNERFRELGFEGFFVHDFRRLGLSVDGFEADADELVFPIPQSERDTNPVIDQNPGY